MAYFPDISTASHGYRTAHYLAQYAGKDAPAQEKVAMLPTAERAASAEMLDEIHQMLCHLTGITKEGKV